MKKPDLVKGKLWHSRLEEFAHGSERIADFCRRVGVPVWSFYYWQQRLKLPEVTKRQVRNGARLGRPSARRPRKLNFVPVQVTAMRSVEVHLPNGARVIVPCQERDAIGAVMAALMSKPPEASQPC